MLENMEEGFVGLFVFFPKSRYLGVFPDYQNPLPSWRSVGWLWEPEARRLAFTWDRELWGQEQSV